MAPRRHTTSPRASKRASGLVSADSAPQPAQGLTRDRRRGISAPLGVSWQHHLCGRTLDIMEGERLRPQHTNPLRENSQCLETGIEPSKQQRPWQRHGGNRRIKRTRGVGDRLKVCGACDGQHPIWAGIRSHPQHQAATSHPLGCLGETTSHLRGKQSRPVTPAQQACNGTGDIENRGCAPPSHTAVGRTYHSPTGAGAVSRTMNGPNPVEERRALQEHKVGVKGGTGRPYETT